MSMFMSRPIFVPNIFDRPDIVKGYGRNQEGRSTFT